MSVCECDRNGCKEIVCDKYIMDHKYRLCWDCFHELEEQMKQWPAMMTRGEVAQKIIDFVHSEKTCRGNASEVVNTAETFKELTRDTWKY